MLPQRIANSVGHEWNSYDTNSSKLQIWLARALGVAHQALEKS